MEQQEQQQGPNVINERRRSTTIARPRELFVAKFKGKRHTCEHVGKGDHVKHWENREHMCNLSKTLYIVNISLDLA